jgi:hypothetical protein
VSNRRRWGQGREPMPLTAEGGRGGGVGGYLAGERLVLVGLLDLVLEVTRRAW